MIHLLALTTCIAGFACLCAAMPRHQADFVGRKLTRTVGYRLRVVGGALLLTALAIDLNGLGGGYGAVAWCGHLTVAAALVLTRLNMVIARAR